MCDVQEFPFDVSKYQFYRENFTFFFSLGVGFDCVLLHALLGGELLFFDREGWRSMAFGAEGFAKDDERIMSWNMLLRK